MVQTGNVGPTADVTADDIVLTVDIAPGDVQVAGAPMDTVSIYCWVGYFRFQHSCCQCKLSTGSHCGGALVEVFTVANLLSAPRLPENDVRHEDMDISHISSHDSDFSYAHSKLISIAIEATKILH